MGCGASNDAASAPPATTTMNRATAQPPPAAARAYQQQQAQTPQQQQLEQQADEQAQEEDDDGGETPQPPDAETLAAAQAARKAGKAQMKLVQQEAQQQTAAVKPAEVAAAAPKPQVASVKSASNVSSSKTAAATPAAAASVASEPTAASDDRPVVVARDPSRPVLVDIVLLVHPECVALATRLERALTAQRYIVAVHNEADLLKAQAANDSLPFLSDAGRVIWILTSGVFSFKGCIYAVKRSVASGADVVLVRQDGSLFAGMNFPSYASIDAAGVPGQVFASKAIEHYAAFHAAFEDKLVERVGSPVAAIAKYVSRQTAVEKILSQVGSLLDACTDPKSTEEKAEWNIGLSFLVVPALNTLLQEDEQYKNKPASAGEQAAWGRLLATAGPMQRYLTLFVRPTAPSASELLPIDSSELEITFVEDDVAQKSSQASATAPDAASKSSTTTVTAPLAESMRRLLNSKLKQIEAVCDLMCTALMRVTAGNVAAAAPLLNASTFLPLLVRLLSQFDEGTRTQLDALLAAACAAHVWRLAEMVLAATPALLPSLSADGSSVYPLLCALLREQLSSESLAVHTVAVLTRAHAGGQLPAQSHAEVTQLLRYVILRFVDGSTAGSAQVTQASFALLVALHPPASHKDTWLSLLGNGLGGALKKLSAASGTRAGMKEQAASVLALAPASASTVGAASSSSSASANSASSSTVAQQPLTPKSYDVFLSHRQLDSQDMIKRLKIELERLGYRVFLDRDDAGLLADLPAIVRASYVFLFVLSPTIFNSPWCVQELGAAIDATKRSGDVRVLSVHQQGTVYAAGTADESTDYPPDSILTPAAQSSVAALKEMCPPSKLLRYEAAYFDSFLAALVARLGPPRIGVPSVISGSRSLGEDLANLMRLHTQLRGSHGAEAAFFVTCCGELASLLAEGAFDGVDASSMDAVELGRTVDALCAAVVGSMYRSHLEASVRVERIRVLLALLTELVRLLPSVGPAILASSSGMLRYVAFALSDLSSEVVIASSVFSFLAQLFRPSRTRARPLAAAEEAVSPATMAAEQAAAKTPAEIGRFAHLQKLHSFLDSETRVYSTVLSWIGFVSGSKMKLQLNASALPAWVELMHALLSINAHAPVQANIADALARRGLVALLVPKNATADAVQVVLPASHQGAWATLRNRFAAIPGSAKLSSSYASTSLPDESFQPALSVTPMPAALEKLDEAAACCVYILHDPLDPRAESIAQHLVSSLPKCLYSVDISLEHQAPQATNMTGEDSHVACVVILSERIFSKPQNVAWVRNKLPQHLVSIAVEGSSWPVGADDEGSSSSQLARSPFPPVDKFPVAFRAGVIHESRSYSRQFLSAALHRIVYVSLQETTTALTYESVLPEVTRLLRFETPSQCTEDPWHRAGFMLNWLATTAKEQTVQMAQILLLPHAVWAKFLQAVMHRILQVNALPSYTAGKLKAQRTLLKVLHRILCPERENTYMKPSSLLLNVVRRADPMHVEALVQAAHDTRADSEVLYMSGMLLAALVEWKKMHEHPLRSLSSKLLPTDGTAFCSGCKTMDLKGGAFECATCTDAWQGVQQCIFCRECAGNNLPFDAAAEKAKHTCGPLVHNPSAFASKGASCTRKVACQDCFVPAEDEPEAWSDEVTARRKPWVARIKHLGFTCSNVKCKYVECQGCYESASGRLEREECVSKFRTNLARCSLLIDLAKESLRSAQKLNFKQLLFLRSVYMKTLSLLLPSYPSLLRDAYMKGALQSFDSLSHYDQTASDAPQVFDAVKAQIKKLESRAQEARAAQQLGQATPEQTELAALTVDTTPEFDYMLAYDRAEVSDAARSVKLSLMARMRGVGSMLRVWDEQDDRDEYTAVLPTVRRVLVILSPRCLDNPYVVDVLSRTLMLPEGARKLVLIKSDGSAWQGKLYPPLSLVPVEMRSYFKDMIAVSMAEIAGDRAALDQSTVQPAIRYSRDYFAPFMRSLMDRLQERKVSSVDERDALLMACLPMAPERGIVPNMHTLLLCLSMPQYMAGVYSPWARSSIGSIGSSSAAVGDSGVGAQSSQGFRARALMRFTELYPSPEAFVASAPELAPKPLLEKLLRLLASELTSGVRAYRLHSSDAQRSFLWSLLGVLGLLAHTPIAQRLLTASPVSKVLSQGQVSLTECNGASVQPLLPLLLADVTELATVWVAEKQFAWVAQLAAWLQAAQFLPQLSQTQHVVLHPHSAFNPSSHALLSARLDRPLVQAALGLHEAGAESNVDHFLSLYPLLSQLLRADVGSSENMLPLLYLAADHLIRFDIFKNQSVKWLEASGELFASALVANGGLKVSCSSDGGGTQQKTLQVEQLTSALWSLSYYYVLADPQVAVGLLFALHQLSLSDESGVCPLLLVEHGLYELALGVVDKASGEPQLLHQWILELMIDMLFLRNPSTGLSRATLLRVGGKGFNPNIMAKLSNKGFFMRFARWKATWQPLYVARTAEEKQIKAAQDSLSALHDTLLAAVDQYLSGKQMPMLSNPCAPHLHPLRPTPALDTACSLCGLTNIAGSLLRCTAGCAYAECPGCYASTSAPLYPHEHPLTEFTEISEASIYGWTCCRVCQRTVKSGGGWRCADPACVDWDRPAVFECHACFPNVSGQRVDSLTKHELAQFRKAALDAQLQPPSVALINPHYLTYAELTITALSGAAVIAFGVTPSGTPLSAPPGMTYPGVDARSHTGICHGIVVERTQATPAGRGWKVADVIGLLINTRTVTIQYSVNGQTEGCAPLNFPGMYGPAAWAVQGQTMHFHVGFQGVGTASVELNVGSRPFADAKLEKHSGLYRHDAAGYAAYSLQQGATLAGAPLTFSASNSVAYAGRDVTWCGVQASVPCISDHAQVYAPRLDAAHRSALKQLAGVVAHQFKPAPAAAAASKISVIQLPGPARPEGPSAAELMASLVKKAAEGAAAVVAAAAAASSASASSSSSASAKSAPAAAAGPAIPRSPEPVYTCSYFEVTLLSSSAAIASGENELALGFGVLPSSWQDHPGACEDSVGLLLHDMKINAYNAELPWPEKHAPKVGDTFGAGFDSVKKKFFFTRNGVLVLQADKEIYNHYKDLTDIPMLPAIGVNTAESDETVECMRLRFNFGKESFKYSLPKGLTAQNLSMFQVGHNVPKSKCDLSRLESHGEIGINGLYTYKKHIGLDVVTINKLSVASVPTLSPLALPKSMSVPAAPFAFFTEVTISATSSSSSSDEVVSSDSSLSMFFLDADWDARWIYADAAHSLTWRAKAGKLVAKELGGDDIEGWQVSRPVFQGDTIGMGVSMLHAHAFLTLNGRVVYVHPLAPASLFDTNGFIVVGIGYGDAVVVNTGDRPFLYSGANDAKAVIPRPDLNWDRMGDGAMADDEGEATLPKVKKGSPARAWKAPDAESFISCTKPVSVKGKWAGTKSGGGGSGEKASSSSSASSSSAAASDDADASASAEDSNKRLVDLPDALTSSSLYKHFLALKTAVAASKQLPAELRSSLPARADCAALRHSHAVHSVALNSLRMQSRLIAHAGHEHWMERVAPGAAAGAGITAKTCLHCDKPPAAGKPAFVCRSCDVLECADCHLRTSGLFQAHPHKLKNQVSSAPCFLCAAASPAHSCPHCPGYAVCVGCVSVQRSLQSVRHDHLQSERMDRAPPLKSSYTAEDIRRDVPADKLGQKGGKANSVAVYEKTYAAVQAKDPSATADTIYTGSHSHVLTRVPAAVKSYTCNKCGEVRQSTVYPGHYCKKPECSDLHVGMCCLTLDSQATVHVKVPPHGNNAMAAYAPAFIAVLATATGPWAQPVSATPTIAFDRLHCHPVVQMECDFACQVCGMEAVRGSMHACTACNYVTHQLCKSIVQDPTMPTIMKGKELSLAAPFACETRPLGSSIRHQAHSAHPLTLVAAVNRGGYACSACSTWGIGAVWRCDACDVSIHPTCCQ